MSVEFDSRSELTDSAAQAAVAVAPTFADEWATQQVVIRFTAHFDAGEHDQMVHYFSPSAIWYQARGPIRGPRELRERLAEMPRDQLMRHVITNLRTTFISRDEALVDSYFTVYLQSRPASDTSIVSALGAKNIGRYRDRVRRVDGRWLLDERRVVFDLRLPHTSDGEG